MTISEGDFNDENCRLTCEAKPALMGVCTVVKACLRH